MVHPECMPNQRAKNKRNVTVTLDDELRLAIEKWAAENGGVDRTAAIKMMCRKMLGVKEKKAGK